MVRDTARCERKQHVVHQCKEVASPWE